MSDKLSFHKCSQDEEGTVSTLASDMKTIVYAAADPRPGETVKAQIRKAWAALGFPSFWRVKAAWYGEAGCWSGEAVRDFQMRDLIRRRKEEAARAQATELGALFAVAAERLREIDPDFHSQQIAQHERAACALGALDRPRTEAA
ncbi:hypothetical protein [Kaistia sp. MMO-174]|uniref:hypothetical protein n=1 Tax=Kaistia sp. MMO-174 TaxID=3081256 RepID=UPI00301A5A03